MSQHKESKPHPDIVKLANRIGLTYDWTMIIGASIAAVALFTVFIMMHPHS